jgi:FtsH-binding integral membrane protein
VNGNEIILVRSVHIQKIWERSRIVSYQYNDQGYQPSYRENPLAAAAERSERLTFIRLTYGHLLGAILAFVALQMLFFNLTTEQMRLTLVAQVYSSPVYLLLMLGAFIGFSYLAQVWASSATSKGMQYAGLGLYVLLEAAIFLPILIIAQDYLRDDSLIPTAGILTVLVFSGLTAGVFITRKDFSFLGGFLWIAGFLAMGVIVCAILFGFGLGMWFSLAMIALASLYILYYTSNVMLNYHTSQYVAAALALFAAVAMLFFYILRLLMASRE